MRVEVAWQRTGMSVVTIDDEVLRAARAKGVDITDPMEVANHVEHVLRADRDWLIDVADDWTEQDSPEIVQVDCWGDPPAWAFADESAS